MAREVLVELGYGVSDMYIWMLYEEHEERLGHIIVYCIISTHLNSGPMPFKFSAFSMCALLYHLLAGASDSCRILSQICSSSVATSTTREKLFAILLAAAGDFLLPTLSAVQLDAAR